MNLFAKKGAGGARRPRAIAANGKIPNQHTSRGAFISDCAGLLTLRSMRRRVYRNPPAAQCTQPGGNFTFSNCGCSPGRFLDLLQGPVQDGEHQTKCQLCPTGTFVGAGATAIEECEPCAAGRVDHDLDPTTVKRPANLLFKSINFSPCLFRTHGRSWVPSGMRGLRRRCSSTELLQLCETASALFLSHANCHAY